MLFPQGGLTLMNESVINTKCIKNTKTQSSEIPLLTSLAEVSPVACIRRNEGVTVIFRQFNHSLEGEYIGQLTLAGTLEEHEVVNAQVY